MGGEVFNRIDRRRLDRPRAFWVGRGRGNQLTLDPFDRPVVLMMAASSKTIKSFSGFAVTSGEGTGNWIRKGKDVSKGGSGKGQGACFLLL